MQGSKKAQREQILTRAMRWFWARGFATSSVRELVEATGASRQALYEAFENKHDLYLASMSAYAREVVDPAFSPVEGDDAGLPEIQQYFEQQIAFVEEVSLPGPGCLFANTMVESGPAHPDFMAQVIGHLDRLTAGFKQALENERRRRWGVHERDLSDVAQFLTISAQGLWSFSRTTQNKEALQRYVASLLAYADMAINSDAIHSSEVRQSA